MTLKLFLLDTDDLHLAEMISVIPEIPLMSS